MPDDAFLEGSGFWVRATGSGRGSWVLGSSWVTGSAIFFMRDWEIFIGDGSVREGFGGGCYGVSALGLEGHDDRVDLGMVLLLDGNFVLMLEILDTRCMYSSRSISSNLKPW